MGKMCGNMTTDLGIYRDTVSTANTLIIMKKENHVVKQQICLDANSAVSRSKFLHFKSVLTILALCLCMVMGGEAWAADLTVAIGTGTNAEIPLYGLYSDDNYQHTQTIYPANMLTDMQGGQIKKLTYYLNSTVTQDYGSTFEVRIGTTNSTSFSSGTVNYISLTSSPVWSGNISLSSSTTLVFDFTSNPYTYTGGNLVVDVRITSLASGYQGFSFYGESGSTYYSVKDRSTSSLPTTSGSAVSFMPKTTFTYTTSGGGSSDCNTENFSGYTAAAYDASTYYVPTGWHSYNNSNSGFAPRISNENNYSFIYNQDGNYLLLSINESNNNRSAFAILPMYSSISSVSFKYRYESTSYGTLTVGYVTNNSGYNTYQVLATPTKSGDWVSYSLTPADIETINSNNGYIAFRYRGNADDSYYSVAIDDIEICTLSSSHTVTWSVDGSTSTVSTSTLTNGQVPSDPTISCGGKVFVGWTTSPISGSQNSAPSPLYSRSYLVGASVAADVTYYAVFANVSSGAPVNTTLWSETWTGGTENQLIGDYAFGGTTVWNGQSLTYTSSTSDNVIKNGNNAGGVAPELFIKKGGSNNCTFSNIPTGGATQMTFTFYSNRGTNGYTLTSTTTGISISAITGNSNPRTCTITATGGVSSFNLKLTNTNNNNGNNARFDNFKLTAEIPSTIYTNYVTSCTTTTYTVTYNRNGGTGNVPTDANSPYNSGSTVTVLGNIGSPALSKTGYVFGGWNTQADGSGITYAAGDNFTINANTTLYALWLSSYTVTWSIDGHLTAQNYPIGNSYALTVPSGVATDATSYNCYDRVFVGWTANSSWSSDNPPADLFRIPTGNVSANTTYYAVFAYEEGASWELVNNVSELSVGNKVVIAAASYNYAISTTQSGNNRAQAEITKSGSTITWSSSVCEFDLKAGTVSGTWAFYDATNTGYIYAASSSSNYLRTQATNDDNGSWAISISNGTATITAQGTNSRNQLKYNNGDNIFSCYGSGQKAVAIYKKVSSYYGYSTSCIPCTDPTFSLPSASGIVNMGSTLSISLTNPNNTEVTWTSSNPSIATVSGTNTGATITGVNYGSATITASIRAANVSGTYYCPATVTYNVTVACATITLPVCFDFEDYASPNSSVSSDAGLPTCWNRIYSGSSSGYAPHVFNGTYAMDANGIVITSGSSSSYGTTNYVVMPFIDGLREDDIIRFNAWWESTSNGTLTFGFMTDPSNAATFSSIGTATAESYSGGSASTGQNEFTIPAAMPSGAYLAFQWSYSSSYYYSVVIDNICIEHACTPIPGTLTLNTTSGSIAAPATLDISGYVNNGIDQTLYPGTLSYIPSNSNVAAVSASGVITGVAEGNAVITVKYTPDDIDQCAKTAEFAVTVTDNCSKIGTGSNTTYKVPINNYYKYTYTQMLFRSNEPGLSAGIITSIGFEYAYSTPMTDKNNVKIYMVETEKTAFSSTTDWVTTVTDANLVYSGALNCSSGWNSFTLDNPFVYSGNRNLLVVIDDNSVDYDGEDYIFKYTATSWNSVISYYSDGTNYGNADIEDATANMTNYTYRPNTKLCIYNGTLHTITYNTSANCTGGVAFPIPNTYGVEGYPATVSSIEPACSDGIFLSWNTEQDGSGTTYASGAPITLTEDITLYAQYRICNYVDILKTPSQGRNDGAMVDDYGHIVDNNGVQKFNICKGATITLQAQKKDGVSADITSYSWDVNRHDGNAHLTSTGSSISYTVNNATGHDVLLIVDADDGCHEEIPLRVFVSKGLTTHDDSPDIGNICVGKAKEIVVGDPTVVAEPIIEVDNDQVEIKSTKGDAKRTFIPDGEGGCYESPVVFADFKESTVITDASNIDYVRINMEHSHIGDMQISLKCKTPENVEKSVVILQNYTNYDWPYNVIECYAYYDKYYNNGAAGGCSMGALYSSSSLNSVFVIKEGNTYRPTGVRQEATSFDDDISTTVALSYLREMINSGSTPADFCDGDYYYVFNSWYQSANDYTESNHYYYDYYEDMANNEWSKENQAASLGFGKPNTNDWWSSNTHKTDSTYNPYGQGLDYCWSNNDDYSYGDAAGHENVLNKENHTVGYTNGKIVVPSDVDNYRHFYRPYESFANLVGCKLNGVWKIEVCDAWKIDNGYVFSWEISLKGVEDNSWEYAVNLDRTALGTCPGSGTSSDDLVYTEGGTNFYIHPTIANVESIPVTIGEQRSCNLTLIDDIGCEAEGNGFKYTIVQPTRPEFSEKPVTICLGEQAHVEAYLVGDYASGGNSSFTWWRKPYGADAWTHDDPELGVISDDFYTIPDHSGDEYRVEIYDANGCGGIIDDIVQINVPNIDGVSNFNYIWKGGTVGQMTDWNTESNWYVYNDTYLVATELPDEGDNVYIGASQCVNRGEGAGFPAQMSLVGSENIPAKAHNLTIASGASLTVPSGKTLNIAGNLTNTGSLNATNGTVVFCGPSSNGGDQTISNNITLGNVTFNNQGGDIVPAGSMTINGAATFTDGIVKKDLVTFGTSSSVANAETMTYNSFVEGTVTKSGSANGFTFPTGQNNVLGKVKVSSDVSGVSVQYFNNPAGFSTAEYPRWWNIADMCPGNTTQFDHVSNFEYWDIATTGVLNAKLTVSSVDSSAHFNSVSPTHNGGDVYGAFWNGNCWENIGGANHSVSAYPYGTISVDVSIPATRAYSKIVSLGSKNHSTVLPIELTALTATCDGRKALVEWTTASERNNDYFSLERSDDAINFTEIARIAGAGNSIAPLDYSYTDYGVHGGDNYYRLVQVDYDGTRTASEIVVANCIEASGEPEVLAYPNPFSGDLTVELENFGDRPARIDVYDMLGRLVYTEEVGAPQNSYQTVLHFGNLPDATYTVRVGTADFVINRKVVKQQ